MHVVVFVDERRGSGRRGSVGGGGWRDLVRGEREREGLTHTCIERVREGGGNGERGRER